MDQVIELTLPSDTFLALQRAALREHKTEAELAVEAIRAYLGQLGINDSLIGLFADEPELMDAVSESAMHIRETSHLRETN
ncbi:MAG TPA: hypothetical protein VFD70_12570 [Anaerolineae bacterium]|nr:hypothetical protein [Anaerolineae bacterium]